MEKLHEFRSLIPPQTVTCCTPFGPPLPRSPLCSLPWRTLLWLVSLFSHIFILFCRAIILSLASCLLIFCFCHLYCFCSKNFDIKLLEINIAKLIVVKTQLKSWKKKKGNWQFAKKFPSGFGFRHCEWYIFRWLFICYNWFKIKGKKNYCGVGLFAFLFFSIKFVFQIEEN